MFDSVITSGAGLVGEHLLGALLTKGLQLAATVRAKAFLETFSRELASASLSDEQIAAKLDKLTQDDACAEALHAAFRQLSLCTTRSTGPRLIALVTALCVAEQREPTSAEVSILDIASKLTDAEFREFRERYGELLRESRPPEISHLEGGIVEVRTSLVRTDETASGKHTDYSDPISIALEVCGNVGLKLLASGLLIPDVERAREGRVTVTIASAIFTPACLTLYQLLGRCEPQGT